MTVGNTSDDSDHTDHTDHSRDHTGMIHRPVSILKKTGEKELKNERKAVSIVKEEMINNLDKQPDGVQGKEEESPESKTCKPLTTIQLGPAPPGSTFS